ncbi:MFS transporter [Sorangium sp. So ce128]|uniref:MFS transporter n=1 Tax=Sorangium sp. So ce128 TaxID=3133281 RepID=UPI003F638EFB
MMALRTSIAGAPLPSEAPDQAASGVQGPARAEAIACVLAAMVLVVLSAGIANVALPALAHAFQVTPAASVRVVSAYQLGLVMALLPCAALGESLGYRAVFTAGVGLFTGASVLCALAPSLHWLVAARFLQGLGGAAVMALGVALLRFVVPQAQLAAAIGWNALAVALSSAAAPTVGAVLLSSASWPWLFAVNLPLGVAVLLASRGLPEVPGTARALDATSMALNAGAFGALIAGAELLPAAPALGAGLLAAAALSATLLLRRELPKEAPLVPLDLLRGRSFRVSVIASVACFAGQASALVALPFYLRHGFGQEALSTGLLITPWPLSVALLAPVAGRLADRISTAWLCATGAGCLALGLAALALSPAQGSALSLVPFVALCGAGFGLFQVPNNRNMFLAAPRARSAAAGGMQGTARLAGQTAGAVVMTLLFTLMPVDAAPRIGLGIGAALTLSAGIVSALRAGSHRSHDGERIGS